MSARRGVQRFLVARARALAFTLALGAGATACGPNASYDGLATGLHEDAALRAPRPLSPVSVSTVATSRPRLKWVLTAAGTGAVVELARSRAFLPEETKRFDAVGTELVIPEDLEAGIWFWRLRGKTRDCVSSIPSPIWEVLVRGPAAHGSSDVPVGTIVDTDGDGQPDLTAVADTSLSPVDGPPAVLLAYRGLPGGTLTVEPEWAGNAEGPSPGVLGASIAAGTDFNGDGYTDIVYAGLGAEMVEGRPCHYPLITLGGPRRSEADGPGPLGWLPYIPVRCGFVPQVAEGGDLDGDGYGDVLVSLDDIVHAILGGTAGLKAPVPLFAEYGAPLRARPVVAAFDANGDGISDVAIALPPEPPVLDSTATAAQSAPPLRKALSVVMTGNQAATLASWKVIDATENIDVSAFTSADFDGDGHSDLAAIIGGNVCFWHGDRTSLALPAACVAPPAGGTFATFTATDLEGDGRDDLVASIKTKEGYALAAIHLREGGAAELTPIAGSPLTGVRLTTIWPGRPGRGRWAAAASDGSNVAIFEGTESRQVITPPRGNWSITKAFARGIR